MAKTQTEGLFSQLFSLSCFFLSVKWNCVFSLKPYYLSFSSCTIFSSSLSVCLFLCSSFFCLKCVGSFSHRSRILVPDLFGVLIYSRKCAALTLERNLKVKVSFTVIFSTSHGNGLKKGLTRTKKTIVK